MVEFEIQINVGLFMLRSFENALGDFKAKKALRSSSPGREKRELSFKRVRFETQTANSERSGRRSGSNCSSQNGVVMGGPAEFQFDPMSVESSLQSFSGY